VADEDGRSAHMKMSDSQSPDAARDANSTYEDGPSIKNPAGE